MRPKYNPHDWYWLADDGRVYASAQQAVVTTSDRGYQEFIKKCPAPRWPVDLAGAQTDEALLEVISKYNLHLNPQDALKTHAHAKHSTVVGDGISVNVGTKTKPQLVEVSTDSAGLSYLQLAYAKAKGDPSSIFDWVDANGSTKLSAAQMVTIFNAVSDHAQAAFSALATVRGAIKSGALTKPADIDNHPAWSNHS